VYSAYDVYPPSPIFKLRKHKKRSKPLSIFSKFAGIVKIIMKLTKKLKKSPLDTTVASFLSLIMLASMDIFVNTSLRKLKIDPFGAPILMSFNAKIYS
jgi:hypothetical protein